MADETKTDTSETTNERRSGGPARGEPAPDVAKPLMLGRKVGMLQHFRPDGSAVAATVIAAESNVVTAVRTKERDGYSGIQLGYGAVDKKKLLVSARKAARFSSISVRQPPSSSTRA